MGLKRFFLTVFLIGTLFSVLAQSRNQKYVDSLKAEIKKADERQSMALLYELAKSYRRRQGSGKDSTLHIAKDLLRLSRKYDSITYEIRALDELGSYYSSLGQTAKGMGYSKEILTISKKRKDTAGIIDGYHSLAFTFFYAGKMDSAAVNDYKAFELQKRYNPENINALALHLSNTALSYFHAGKLDKALSLLNEYVSYAQDTLVSAANRTLYLEIMGNIRVKQGKYQDAIAPLQTALAIARQIKDPSSMYFALIKLGTIYNRLGNEKKALDYLTEGVPIAKSLNFKESTADGQLEIGLIHNQRKQYRSAIAYFKESAVNYDAVDKPIFKAIALKNIGLVKENLGNIPEAKNYFKRAREFGEQGVNRAKASENTRDLMDGYQLLFEVESKLGNHLKSLDDYKKYIAYRDAIYDDNNQSALEALEGSYEKEKKEREIEYLKTQNELTNLQNQKQKKYLRAQLIILALVFVLLLVFLNRTIIKQKALKVIQKKSDENMELVQEVQYRVKNNLQIIMSIINSQIMLFDNKKEVKDALVDNQSKIKSVSLVYDRLSENLEEDVIRSKPFFEELVNSIKVTYDTDAKGIEFRLDLEDHPIAGNKAVPLGLVLNELLTNAVKHSFSVDCQEKRISLDFMKEVGSLYTLTLGDGGLSAFSTIDFNAPKTFGLQMVQGLLEQIGGNMRMQEIISRKIVIEF